MMTVRVLVMMMMVMMLVMMLVTMVMMMTMLIVTIIIVMMIMMRMSIDLKSGSQKVGSFEVYELMVTVVDANNGVAHVIDKLLLPRYHMAACQ